MSDDCLDSNRPICGCVGEAPEASSALSSSDHCCVATLSNATRCQYYSDILECTLLDEAYLNVCATINGAIPDECETLRQFAGWEARGGFIAFPHWPIIIASSAIKPKQLQRACWPCSGAPFICGPTSPEAKLTLKTPTACVLRRA